MEQNKTDRLIEFCRRVCTFEGKISKGMILNYGCDNYFYSADRVIRKKVEAGETFRALTTEEKKEFTKNTRLAWYALK